MTLWSGRTEKELAAEVREFLRGGDAELLPYDCRGTLVHAKRLRKAGLLTDTEFEEVEQKLAEIEQLGASAIDENDEDVHSAIERQLGPVGRKIHAGRSRNDQVAIAFRLYVQEACRDADDSITAFALAILDRAEAEAETLMPGYTHLQRGQPITLGHHLLAWVEMLERDRARFAFAGERARPSPLGAGALAGSTLELPAPEAPMRNSLDAVSDRDFALDYLFAAAGLFVHLSRVAEEIALWATAEFGFLHLPEEAATGSSMMPQKLNPDVAELVRGKTGTLIGRLTGSLATLKSLPLSYNLDLQEDKPPVFATRHDVGSALAALGVLVSTAEFDRERLAAATADPLLLATDVAEDLVRDGVPFRDAHEQVASSVREATYETSGTAAESVRNRPAPGPGDVRTAVLEARVRLS